MSSLLSLLEGFNRKERFFLVGMALGNPRFCLSDAFREALDEALGVQIPKDAFVAMDYHLDWLAASLHLAAQGGAPGPYRRAPAMFTATQEDIDLLVAYEDQKGGHIILIEAKGVTGFSNKQFRSKVNRLAAIFAGPDARISRANPRLALVSPREPQQLDCSKCPRWMLRSDGTVPWLHLPLPYGLKKVVRCDKDGTVSQQGDCWKVALERRAG